MRRSVFSAIPLFFISVVPNAHPLHDVDLAIGQSSSWERPSILIAWRNTFKIFEAEVLVKNLGSDAGDGRVFLEIVDEDGTVLLTKPQSGSYVSVEVPGKDEGGLDGVLVQIMGTKEANRLIDRLDRDGVKYSIKARVDTVEGDADPTNNILSKTYNSETRFRAGTTVERDFVFKNNSETSNLYRAVYETNSNAQPHWDVRLGIESAFELKPGETKAIPLSISASSGAISPSRFDVRLKLIDDQLNEVSDVKEWFVALDDTPPDLSEADEVLQSYEGLGHIEVVASDAGSGIKEASGVRLEYSTDGGFTYSNKVMAYLDGNFLEPTRFIAEIGPFALGTEVNVAVSASDSVGNITRRDLGTLTIVK